MHLMIDLETMGLAPNGAIAQIGYVAFSPLDGSEKACRSDNIILATNKVAGLEFDGDTINWWLNQSDAARQSLQANQTTLRTALVNLDNFILQHTITAVWAYPSTFDIGILEGAYRRLGLNVPWHYRTGRDARTIIAQMLTKGELVKQGTEHNALDDCRNQIRWLMLAANRLGIVLK